MSARIQSWSFSTSQLFILDILTLPVEDYSEYLFLKLHARCHANAFMTNKITRIWASQRSLISWRGKCLGPKSNKTQDLIFSIYSIGNLQFVLLGQYFYITFYSKFFCYAILGQELLIIAVIQMWGASSLLFTIIFWLLSGVHPARLHTSLVKSVKT